MSKQWQRPELVVLARSKPEEGILQVCKDFVGGILGPDVMDAACQWSEDTGACQDVACATLAES